MTIYLINLSMILIWWVITSRSHFKNKKKIYVTLVGLQLFILLALRKTTVGTDVRTYLWFFELIPQMDLSNILNHRFEVGYVLFMKIMSLISTDERLFIAVISFFIVFSISIFIYKHSKFPMLSFYLYVTLGFYSFTFSGLRQAIAFSILLFGYDYIKDHKFIKFSLVVLLAASFHFTALIFIFAYFMARRKLNTLNFISYVFLFLFVFALKSQIMRFLTAYIFTDYNFYNSGAYTVLLISAVIVIGCLMFYKQTTNNNPYSVVNYNLVMFSLILISFASTSSNVLRASNYFYYYIILLLPDVTVSIKKKNERLIIVYTILILTTAQYLYLLPKSYLGILPYAFFWQ